MNDRTVPSICTCIRVDGQGASRACTPLQFCLCSWFQLEPILQLVLPEVADYGRG